MVKEAVKVCNKNVALAKTSNTKNEYKLRAAPQYCTELYTADPN